MPATIETYEKFPRGIAEPRLQEEQRLRLKAGAITSTYRGAERTGWTLTTVWNIIGEQ
jgi:hypothetical protein